MSCLFTVSVFCSSTANASAVRKDRNGLKIIDTVANAILIIILSSTENILIKILLDPLTIFG